MSATLTPERKSARDRPGVGHKMRDWGRERGGHRRLDRGARGRSAHSVTLVEMINARGRALAAANLITQQSEPFLSRQSARLPLASTAASACQSRRQRLPPPCSPSIIRRHKPPGETFPQFPQNQNRKSEKGVVRLRTIIAHCLATKASCVLVRVCRVLKAHSVHKLGATQRQRCGSNAVRNLPSRSSPIKVYKQQDHQPHR